MAGAERDDNTPQGETPLERLQSVLDATGVEMAASTFADVLYEMGEPLHEALTDDEREFLFETTDLTERDLEPRVLEGVNRRVAWEQASAEGAARKFALSTAEAAEYLGWTSDRVREAEQRGQLYALPHSEGQPLRFPPWQFEDGGVLPGLDEFAGEFPERMHPLDILRFMARPSDALEGMTPLGWLGAGHPTEFVASLVKELRYA